MMCPVQVQTANWSLKQQALKITLHANQLFCVRKMHTKTTSFMELIKHCRRSDCKIYCCCL